MTNTTTRDVHQEVTDRIVAAIERGTLPWQCDWLQGGLPRRATGEQYRGINLLLLGMVAADRGYASPTWVTFNQAKALGGCVRKGERGSPVVFFKRLEKTETAADGSEEVRGIPMLRAYTVFNVDQVDGLPTGYGAPAPIALEPKARDLAAEAALRSSGADIREDGGTRAYYSRRDDTIHLPAFDRFKDTGGFLATMTHELVHWTGAPSRLDRTKGERFGDAAYAFEELVAEIGAAFTCARLGVAGDHIESHAAYVANWLTVFRDDKRAIFRAAALAQSAADRILHAHDGSGPIDTALTAIDATPGRMRQLAGCLGDAARQPAFAF
jgi:antirestriction protein ArdC